MKKIIILTVSMFLLVGFYTRVSAVTNNSGKVVFYQSGDTTKKMEKVLVDELPTRVKDVLLTNDEYKGWEITSDIYKVKSDAGINYYRIELKKDLRSKIVNLDKNGKKISEDTDVNIEY